MMTTGPYGDSPYGQANPDPTSTPQPQPPQAYPGAGYPNAAYPAASQPGMYPPGAYPVPSAPPVSYGMYPQPKNGLGTSSLVLGIIGLVFCWALWPGWVLGSLAIIFGAVGLSRVKNGQASNRSSARAGLILGIFAVALPFFALMFLFSMVRSLI